MDASSSASTPSPCSGTALCRLLLHTRKEATGCCTEPCRVGWCGEDISSSRPPDSSVIGVESMFGSARGILKNYSSKPLQNRGGENPSHTLKCGKVLDQFWQSSFGGQIYSCRNRIDFFIYVQFEFHSSSFSVLEKEHKYENEPFYPITDSFFVLIAALETNPSRLFRRETYVHIRFHLTPVLDKKSHFSSTSLATIFREAILHQIGCFFTHCVNGP